MLVRGNSLPATCGTETMFKREVLVWLALVGTFVVVALLLGLVGPHVLHRGPRHARELRREFRAGGL